MKISKAVAINGNFYIIHKGNSYKISKFNNKNNTIECYPVVVGELKKGKSNKVETLQNITLKTTDIHSSLIGIKNMKQFLSKLLLAFKDSYPYNFYNETNNPTDSFEWVKPEDIYIDTLNRSK